VRFIQTTGDEGWRLTPQRLEAICKDDPDRPRLLILNYPGNPDGSTYSADELRGIADVAKTYRIVLLSDEIYGPLNHRDEHVSIAKFYPEGTIVSGGLSKWCGAGGWRLGTFAFPPSLSRVLRAMAATASETFTATSAPIQYAAVSAFRGSPAIDDYLRRSRQILSTLGGVCTARLRKSGAILPEPKGGFYLFPDFSPLKARLAARGIETGRQLAERALEELGVAFLPGEDFALTPQSLTARLAYVDFDGAAALDAAAKETVDERFVQPHCASVVEGVESLCAWLEG